jgi:hypothetical protein
MADGAPRDMAGFYGLGESSIPLEPEQRREITRERERVDKEERKYRDGLAEGLAQSGPPSVLDPFIDAENAKASVILTKRQERLQSLGLIEQPDGSVLHVTEVRRREARRTPDAEGVTPEEREQMEAYLAADDEEADMWHDLEGEE